MSDTNDLEAEAYDVIFVGSGLVNLLEAVHQTHLGRKVVVLERSECPGGAWKTVNMNGWTNVENAVHYFLPDRKAEKFLRESLNIQTSRKRPTYIVRDVLTKSPNFGDFHSIISSVRLLQALWQGAGNSKLHGVPQSNFLRVVKQAWRLVKNRSWYPVLGSVELTDRILEIARFYNIQIRFDQDVKTVTVREREVTVHSQNKVYAGSQLVLSDGLTDISVFIKQPISFQINFPNRGAFRPQLLLLLEDSKIELLAQFIFIGDSNLKYVHEISGYASAPSRDSRANERILAIALQPDVSIDHKRVQVIIQQLKDLNIVSIECGLIQFQFVSATIPDMDYRSIEELVRFSGDRVMVLSTENLAHALGCNARRWKRTIADWREGSCRG